MSQPSHQQFYYSIPILSIAAAIGLVAIPGDKTMAQLPQIDCNLIKVQIINGGFKREGCTLSLRNGGSLYDIDGHPIQNARLKEFLADQQLLNQSNELVINLHVGDRKATLEQLAHALQIIQSCVPNRNTFVYISLPLKRVNKATDSESK